MIFLISIGLFSAAIFGLAVLAGALALRRFR